MPLKTASEACAWPLHSTSQVERDCFERMMEKHFLVHQGLGLTEAVTKEEFYGFDVNQVWLVHFHKLGVGAGLFYRLVNGSVIDASGVKHDPDALLYDQPVQ